MYKRVLMTVWMDIEMKKGCPPLYSVMNSLKLIPSIRTKKATVTHIEFGEWLEEKQEEDN